MGRSPQEDDDITACEGCLYFIEVDEGYDEVKRKNVWRTFCRLGKTYSADDPCWREPLCDLDVMKTFTQDELSDFQTAVENIGKSAKELLAWVTEHGFDTREPLRTMSYTVEQLRDIIRRMDYIYNFVDEKVKI